MSTTSIALCSVLALFVTAASPGLLAQEPTVVGWRGDGSGRYPNANPPTTWSRDDSGAKKNILWETKLPCYSWATPIIVGDKIFVRSDPYDLICLNKKDGKILWIRSHGPQVAVTDEDRKANPGLAAIDPLVAQLKQVNDAYVEKGSSPELLKQKHDLQHQIDDIFLKNDRKYKLPKDMWVESWSEYTGSTPCSDGTNIYFTSGAGVTGCFDLNGNLKWSNYESLAAGWGEHGDPDSPTLSGDKFIVAEGPKALDKATGKQVWFMDSKPANASENREQFGMVTFKFNGTDFVIARGNVLRVSDGKSFLKLPWVFSAPVVHDDMINNVHGGGGYSFKMEALPNGEMQGKSVVNGPEYPGFIFPLENPEKKDSTFYTASPLYHDGLLYCLSNTGWLVTVDTKATTPKDAIVYAKKLPFDFKNPPHRKTFGCGIGASPAFAGKYIYLTDNAGCTIVMEPGREYKQVAKNNLDHIMDKGWEEFHWNDHYHETTLASPIFEENRIYIRGEQYLYCIGEK